MRRRPSKVAAGLAATALTAGLSGPVQAQDYISFGDINDKTVEMYMDTADQPRPISNYLAGIDTSAGDDPEEKDADVEGGIPIKTDDGTRKVYSMEELSHGSPWPGRAARFCFLTASTIFDVETTYRWINSGPYITETTELPNGKTRYKLLVPIESNGMFRPALMKGRFEAYAYQTGFNLLTLGIDWLLDWLGKKYNSKALRWTGKSAPIAIGTFHIKLGIGNHKMLMDAQRNYEVYPHPYP